MKREASERHEHQVHEIDTDLRGIPGKLGLLDATARGLRTHVPGRAVPLPTGGGPAPRGVRERVEAVTGADLSGVRVHGGADAAAHAEAIDARAFTIGNDIYMGAGQLGSTDADHLLAHELAHAAQQQGGAVHAQPKLRVGGEGDAAEGEADAIADAALAGHPTRIAATRSEPAVRRVRLTGGQARRLEGFDTSVYFELGNRFDMLIKDARNDANDEPKGLVELTAAITAMTDELGNLDKLTQHDVDPAEDKASSQAAERSLDDLEATLTQASQHLGTLEKQERIAASKQLDTIVAAIAKLAERAHELAQRTVGPARKADKKLKNEESAHDLLGTASSALEKHHGKAYKQNQPYGRYGSIDESIEHLAKTGRLDEIADELTKLLESRAPEKSDSNYHKSFFGPLGGKDKLDKLIASALHNIAHPETIFQGTKGTCAAAVLEMLIAIQEPATYIRMVRDLASTEGKTKLRDNQIDTIKVSARKDPGNSDGTDRNRASALMQPALMETMRIGQQYDNKSDRFLKSNGPTADHGATDSQLQHGSRAVLQNPVGKETKEAPTKGRAPQAAGLEFGGRGHEVLLVHQDQSYMYFVNSQLGRQEKMALDEWAKLEKVVMFESGESDKLMAFKDTLMSDDPGKWTQVTVKDLFG